MQIKLVDEQKCVNFVNVFQYLKLFTTNINIHISSERMYIQGMDPSHVSIYELNLMSNWFDEYNVESDDLIGVNSGILFKILNARGQGQTICMHRQDDSFELDLTSNETNKENFNKYFKVPMIDIDEEMMEIPDNDYQLNISMQSKTFKSIIDQLSGFGDTIDVIYKEDKIYLKSESTEEGEMKIEISLDDLDNCEVEEDLDMKKSYASRYMHMFTQFQKISKEIYISFHNDLPVKVIYKMDEGDNNFIQFYLAPKISDDD
uniref:Proliferating cell nuclear antigen PCNA N-terminal domain-containing protein n=1 Tax=viral metagenome TaxID=1070528 RepID=A0A6C0BUC8_9ZZZZ